MSQHMCVAEMLWWGCFRGYWIGEGSQSGGMTSESDTSHERIGRPEVK